MEYPFENIVNRHLFVVRKSFMYLYETMNRNVRPKAMYPIFEMILLIHNDFVSTWPWSVGIRRKICVQPFSQKALLPRLGLELPVGSIL